jgi:DNA-binding transcriptional LysR family regulator
MPADVQIRQLEYLVALAREQHFGRAATACHASQPALSAAVRKLEKELGVTIVQRGQRFEGFTSEGLRVVGWAYRILAERDALLIDLSRMREGLTATLRIGSIPTAVSVTALLSQRFTARHPHAHVRIETLSASAILQGLASYDIDAGLTYLDGGLDKETHHVPLYRERYLLLTPESTELARQPSVDWLTASRLPLCSLSRRMQNRRILDLNMESAGGTHAPVIETDTVEGLYAHLTVAGLSSIVSHAWLHGRGVPPGMAVLPLEETRSGPVVGLIVPALSSASLLAEELVASLKDLNVEEALNESAATAVPSSPPAV